VKICIESTSDKQIPKQQQNIEGESMPMYCTCGVGYCTGKIWALKSILQKSFYPNE